MSQTGNSNSNRSLEKDNLSSASSSKNEMKEKTSISNEGSSTSSEGEKSSSIKKPESETVIDKLASQLRKISLPTKVLDELSIDGLIKYIQEHRCRNIITMVGAGISTAAGIPDFRTPGTGIYHNLKKYNLPYFQAIFELNYFMTNPEPFYQLAYDLLPGEYKPTKAHYFIKLLEVKGLLLRHYTQNIDNLDRQAGISDDKLIEAHGTFYKSHCLKCKHEYDFQWLKEKIRQIRVTNNVPHCERCNGVVKPDIVFFGENLPEKFYHHVSSDFKSCDVLIIMGSSLEVEPFASLALRARKTCPRLIINATEVGKKINFRYGETDNLRDVFWLGDCNAGCQLLADKLGWSEELSEMCKSLPKKS